MATSTPTLEDLAAEVMELSRRMGVQMHGQSVSWQRRPYNPEAGLGGLLLDDSTNYVVRKLAISRPVTTAVRARMRYRQAARVGRAAKNTARKAAKGAKWGLIAMAQLPQILTTAVILTVVVMLTYGLWVVGRKIESYTPWNIVPNAAHCGQGGIERSGFLWFGDGDDGGTSFVDFSGAMGGWVGRKLNLGADGLSSAVYWSISSAGKITATLRHTLQGGDYLPQGGPATGSAQPASFGGGCCPTAGGGAASPTAYRPVAGPAAAGLTAEQAGNVRVILSTGTTLEVPDQAKVIALATARQESGLRNLNHGDRDSLGLFQQRPSQGWGTAAQVTDPVYASNAFFTALLAVPSWQSMPVTVAAQAVQRSGYPNAYAQWEGQARTWLQTYGPTAGANQPVATTTGCNSPAVPAGYPTPGNAPVAVQQVLAFARSQEGKPYRLGAAPMPSPSGPMPATYDCSSLVDSAYLAANIDLPGRQTTATLISLGTAVPNQASLQPGDLIFTAPGHVAIAISPTRMIAAPHTGDVVKEQDIYRFFAARRIIALPGSAA